MPVSHNQVLGQKCFRRTNVRNQHLERTLSTIAYNALHVIYHDTVSCNIFKLRCICVINEQTAIILPQNMVF